MKWNVLHSIPDQQTEDRVQAIVQAILDDRGLSAPESAEAFFHPPDPLTISPEDVGIDRAELDLALERIKQAITTQQPILIFGDYDADGITATAILWESLHSLGAAVTPFIPVRERHGYGLSVVGLEEALGIYGDVKPLVITVDNGVVAHEAADYLAGNGIELIITDHHQLTDTRPACLALVHSDQIAGSAVAWMVAKELSPESAAASLDLVTIGTVADMMPLTGTNRAIVKAGIPKLQRTHRVGLKALYSQAGIEPGTDFTTYEINFQIAPRLNAMGRLGEAMESLRLLCTTSKARAKELAQLLGETNRYRQDLTVEALELAMAQAELQSSKLLVIDGEAFHEGVIGLVAGKLVERFYRPTLVIQRDEMVSKGSGRSVKGVHLIQMIRRHEHLLINAGGHPMAAGFSVETEQITAFREAIQQDAEKHIDETLLEPAIDIDCMVSPADIGDELYYALDALKPFGIGNRRPVLAMKDVSVQQVQLIGKDKRHLRMQVVTTQGTVGAIGFGMGEHYEACKNAMQVSMAFTLDENVWNGRRSLQLRLRDVSI